MPKPRVLLEIKATDGKIVQTINLTHASPSQREKIEKGAKLMWPGFTREVREEAHRVGT